ncbi:MAG: hypothetical protein DI535_03505 [Citrobacter freundii]|nr:MAG: hypothetical protein DI535_03505 [Citrobacter freundii]
MFKFRIIQAFRFRVKTAGTNGYLGVRDRWVKLMQRLTGRMSMRKQKAGMVICTLLSACYSVWVIISGFQQKTNFSLPIDNIKKPGYITSPALEDPRSTSDLPQGERLRLQSFVNYMDSLLLSPAGKTLYDSIHNVRPGLLDSVRQLLKS